MTPDRIRKRYIIATALIICLNVVEIARQIGVSRSWASCEAPRWAFRREPWAPIQLDTGIGMRYVLNRLWPVGPPVLSLPQRTTCFGAAHMQNSPFRLPTSPEDIVPKVLPSLSILRLGRLRSMHEGLPDIPLRLVALLVVRARRVRVAVAAVALIAGASLAAQQPGVSPSIQGVWKVVEETNNWRTITSPSPGYIVFTAKHFALVREAQDIKRPDVRDVDNATAQQLLAMWGPFAAHFGTYEVKGDVVALTLLVAKNPSQMNTQQFQRLRLQANTLMTEPLRDASGTPLAKPIRMKMVRVE